MTKQRKITKKYSKDLFSYRKVTLRGVGVIAFIFAVAYLGLVFKTTALMAEHKSFEKDTRNLSAEVGKLQSDVYDLAAEVLSQKRANGTLSTPDESDFTYISRDAVAPSVALSE